MPTPARAPCDAPELIDRILFPAPPSTYNAGCWPGELIWLNQCGDPGDNGRRGADDELPTPFGDDTRIPALLLLAPVSRFFVLCLHGNGDDLGRFYNFCHRLRVCCSVHVLAVEYPGYGICPGYQATDASVNHNSFVGLRFLTDSLKWPIEDILVFGRSVGCGPALEIAARHRVRGVSLVSPFMSTTELAQHYLGKVGSFVPERYNNMALIPQVRCPVLIVHGKQDTLVPCDHGKALFEACKARKFLVIPEAMGHNTNLYRDTSFFAIPFLSFFAVLPPVQREVRVPACVYERPRTLEYSCTAFFGTECCMPRSEPTMMPSAHLTGSAAQLAGAAPASSSRGCGFRPQVSRVVPMRSTLSEPAYDAVCRPRRFSRSIGDPALSAWPRHEEFTDELSDADLDDVDASAGMPAAPVLPSMPDAWAAPDDLAVPFALDVQGGAEDESDRASLLEDGKPAWASQRSTASGEDAQELDQEFGMHDSFHVRLV